MVQRGYPQVEEDNEATHRLSLFAQMLVSIVNRMQRLSHQHRRTRGDCQATEEHVEEARAFGHEPNQYCDWHTACQQ